MQYEGNGFKIFDSEDALAEDFFNDGVKFFSSNRIDRAFDCFTDAISFKPNYVEAYIKRGMCSFVQRHYEDALTDLDEAVRIDPESAEAYRYLGFVKTEMSRYDAAVKDFETSIRIAPDEAGTYNDYGYLLKKMGDFHGACKIYSNGIDLAQTDPAPFFNRANVRMFLCDLEGAIKDYEEALKLGFQHAGYALGAIRDPNYRHSTEFMILRYINEVVWKDTVLETRLLNLYLDQHQRDASPNISEGSSVFNFYLANDKQRMYDLIQTQSDYRTWMAKEMGRQAAEDAFFGTLPESLKSEVRKIIEGSNDEDAK